MSKEFNCFLIFESYFNNSIQWKCSINLLVYIISISQFNSNKLKYYPGSSSVRGLAPLSVSNFTRSVRAVLISEAKRLFTCCAAVSTAAEILLYLIITNSSPEKTASNCGRRHIQDTRSELYKCSNNYTTIS